MSENYNRCFICGKDNPDGLQLVFTYPDDRAVAQVNIPEKFAGYPGVVHGGMVAALLDEAMAKICLAKGGMAVTGRMNLEYKKPVHTQNEYIVSGIIDNDKGRILECSAKLADTNGRIHAKASAVFVRVKE